MKSTAIAASPCLTSFPIIVSEITKQANPEKQYDARMLSNEPAANTTASAMQASRVNCFAFSTTPDLA